ARRARKTIPAGNLRYRHLEESRDLRKRIAASHGVSDRTHLRGGGGGVDRACGELDVLAGAQWVVGLNAVQACQLVHVHPGALRNRPERIPAAHHMDMAMPAQHTPLGTIEEFS